MSTNWPTLSGGGEEEKLEHCPDSPPFQQLEQTTEACRWVSTVCCSHQLKDGAAFFFLSQSNFQPKKNPTAVTFVHLLVFPSARFRRLIKKAPPMNNK